MGVEVEGLEVMNDDLTAVDVLYAKVKMDEDRWMDGWMDGWMNRWMDGWMDRWMDGWMDG